MLDERKRRIAENESRFRDINERLEADVAKLGLQADPIDFVCECGVSACTMTVTLSLDEYRHVRQDRLLFAVVPGHELPEAEDVITRTERYVVVRKHVDAAEIVET